jgi:rfaE bifunctional protein nucleotidyltransferase chain/domain
MRYAFDIDNTLVKTNGSDYENSVPIQHRIDRVNRLFDEGHTIYLFTARGMSSGMDLYEFTVNQMREFGVKHHQLIMGKPNVDVFVDDKAISVNDWDQKDLFSKSPVIWTNGCYDIVHVGHICLFEKCQELATACNGKFVIGIDSDKRVKKMKGNSRPFNTENDRARVLLNIKGVDSVRIYDSDEELENLIKTFSPEVMVLGDEYKNSLVIGASHAKSIIYFPKLSDYSTSKILKIYQNKHE